MVNKWTPELDAILVQSVFQECNVSFSKALCTKIAERVTAAGMECTPKAIEGRLYAWKKKAVSGGSNVNTSNSTPVKKPAAAAAPKAGGSRAKGKGKAKNVDEDDYPEGLVDDDDALGEAITSALAAAASPIPSSAVSTKKGKAKAAAKPKPKPKGKRAAKEIIYKDESSEEEAAVHVNKKVKKQAEEDDFDANDLSDGLEDGDADSEIEI